MCIMLPLCNAEPAKWSTGGAITTMAASLWTYLILTSVSILLKL